MRRCIWDRAVPVMPVETPMIAVGFPSRGMSGSRKSQSIAFLRTPGT